MDKVSRSGIPVQKIDVDQSQGETQTYNIQNVPTVIKVDSQGNVVGKLIGVNSEQKVKQFYNG
jgi:thioredoxin-like negative regulator of GroEL